MSISSIESLAIPSHEQDEALRTVVGIGVLIVLKDLSEADDQQLQILSVRQGESKPETGKIEGSLSLVQETIKVDPVTHIPESPTDTLRGAMEEVIDAQGVRDVGHHFRRVLYKERPEIPLFTLPGTAGGLEVVIYDGPAQYAFNPTAKKEIAGPPQWLTVANFLNDPTARDTSLEIVNHAASNRMLTHGLHRSTSPVFPEGYQFDYSHRQREKLPDITRVRR